MKDDKKFWGWKNIIPALCGAFAIALAVTTPGLEIFFNNRSEFTLSGKTAGEFFALGFSAVFFISFLPLFLVRKREKIYRLATVIFLGTAISILLQYILWCDIFPDVPPGDVYKDLSFIPSVVLHASALLAIPVLAVVFRDFCFRHIVKLTFIIFAARLAGMFYPIFIAEPPDYDFTEYTIEEKDKFTFGKKRNVIVLLVDALGEKRFKEVIAADPVLAEELKDFSAFDRIVSTTPATKYAVPGMLTGVVFPHDYRADDPREHAEYLNSSCRAERSIFVQLRRAGYRVEGYPFILQTICYHPDIIDNSVEINLAAKSSSVMKIVDISVYRMIPFFLRPFLLDRYLKAIDPFVTPQDGVVITGRQENHDIRFYDMLKNDFRTGDADNVFKYLHINGLHQPMSIDENMQETPDTNPARQLRGAWKIVSLLLKKLKQENLYDESLIVIAGDHTEKYSPEVIALVKRPGEHREKLFFNSIPCQLTDIASTVVKESGANRNFSSLFDRDPIISDGSVRPTPEQLELSAAKWVPADKIPEADMEWSYKYYFFSGKKLKLAGPDMLGKTVKAEFFLEKCDGEKYCCRAEINLNELWKKYEAEEEKIELDHYVSPPIDVPDGIYKAAVYEEFANAIREDGKIRRNTVIPQFIVVRGGKMSFAWQRPDSIPRPLQPGEKVIFRPLEEYPQVQLPPFPHSMPRHDGIAITENTNFSVRIGEVSEGDQLSFTLRSFPMPHSDLELLCSGAVLARIPAENTESTVISMPLKMEYANSLLRLSFRLVPRYRNRDGGIPPSKLVLQSLEHVRQK